jgi:hypothetical protein
MVGLVTLRHVVPVCDIPTQQQMIVVSGEGAAREEENAARLLGRETRDRVQQCAAERSGAKGVVRVRVACSLKKQKEIS